MIDTTNRARSVPMDILISRLSAPVDEAIVNELTALQIDPHAPGKSPVKMGTWSGDDNLGPSTPDREIHAPPRPRGSSSTRPFRISYEPREYTLHNSALLHPSLKSCCPFTLIELVAYRKLVKPLGAEEMTGRIRDQMSRLESSDTTQRDHLYLMLKWVSQVRIITAIAQAIFDDEQLSEKNVVDLTYTVAKIRTVEAEMRAFRELCSDPFERSTYEYKTQCAGELNRGMIGIRFCNPRAPVKESFCKVVSQLITRQNFTAVLQCEQGDTALLVARRGQSCDFR